MRVGIIALAKVNSDFPDRKSLRKRQTDRGVGHKATAYLLKGWDTATKLPSEYRAFPKLWLA